jgi:hypothetical protein
MTAASGPTIATRFVHVANSSSAPYGRQSMIDDVLKKTFNDLLLDQTYDTTNPKDNNYISLGIMTKANGQSWDQGAANTWITNKDTNGLKYIPANIRTAIASGKVYFYGGYLPIPFICGKTFLWKMDSAEATAMNTLYETIAASHILIGDHSNNKTHSRVATKSNEATVLKNAINTAVSALASA